MRKIEIEIEISRSFGAFHQMFRQPSMPQASQLSQTLTANSWEPHESDSICNPEKNVPGDSNHIHPK